jgi:hypothetical protein
MTPAAAPVTFSKAQMLDCVPGLAWKTFSQWVKRDLVMLPAGVRRGTGHKRFYSPSDIIQIATIQELTRHGFPPRDAELVWLMLVRGRLMARAMQKPGDAFDLAAVLRRRSGGGAAPEPSQR